MALSVGTKQVIEKWLRERCPTLKCAACGGASLDIHELVVCAPKHKPMGALAGRGPTTDFLPLVCTRCGFTMFFSVKAIGLTV